MGNTHLAKRLKVVPVHRSKFEYHGKVVDETEIDRLLLVDAITPSDHSILENFMRLLLKANFVGIRSPVYEAPVSADPSIVGDRRANQIRAVVSLFRKLDERIGKEKRMCLVNLVLLDRKWPGDGSSLGSVIETLGQLLRR